MVDSVDGNKRIPKIPAFILARSGSKRLPGKNIKPFAGKALICHTFECAKKSKYLSEIFLSTDNRKIATLGHRSKISVPFLRPKALAKDRTTSREVLKYTIKRLEKNLAKKFEAFVLLQPTSPLRMPGDINRSIEIFWRERADGVVSVVKSVHPKSWLKLIQNGRLVDVPNEKTLRAIKKRRRKTYIPNGAVYVYTRRYLFQKAKQKQLKILPFVMPQERSIDIDTFFDFWLAEKLFMKQHARKR